MGKIRNYFDVELISTLIHTITGIIAGYISFLLNSPGLAFLIMVVILIVSIGIVKISLKVKKDSKWWLGNGIIAYIVVWLVVWSIYYNTVIR